MKKVLIIGFGTSGRSAARFLISKNISVTAVDAKCEELLCLNEVRQLIDDGVCLISDKAIGSTNFDYAVCSPGIASTHPLLQKLKNIPVISEVDLAFHYISQPILGISGTNGKTTVTLLTTHILNIAGKKARALGNVGVALTSAIDALEPNEIVVAELSSYQLEGLKGSILEASVLLNITPDHLDRYGTMEKYAQAKLQLQKITKDPSKFYIEAETNQKFLKNLKASTIGYFSKDHYLSTDLKGIFLKGKHVSDLPNELQDFKSHDVENFMAAFALCYTMGVPPHLISASYASFVKPHHRIEFVAEINGIKFYDDSKGTNIDAVNRAVERMSGPVHLIAGGMDKGASYTPWKNFQGRVVKIHAIGEAKTKIKVELDSTIPVILHESLKEAVMSAFFHSVRGNNVLLSPGCSSFDMFKDYVERGQIYQKIVKDLIN